MRTSPSRGACGSPLVSVAKLIEESWRVMFDEAGSYVMHKKSGNMVTLHTERCVFVVQAFLEQDPKTTEALSAALSAVARPADEQVFTRQAP